MHFAVLRALGLASLIVLPVAPVLGQIIEVPEGWGTSQLPQTPERQAAFKGKLNGAQALFSESPQSPTAVVSNLVAAQAPDAITPEITALAEGLENDPMRIFNWVKRNIRYVPYSGCVKGAMLTLLERSGNDFDQCALLAALLRCGGVTVRYNLGAFYFSDATAANYWQTFEPNVTSGNIFSELGLMTDNVSGVRYIPRVYVVAVLPGVEVKMDPSFRNYQSRTAMTLAQLTASCGISRSGLLTQAGGANRPPPEQDVLWQYHQLNSAGFASYLNAGVAALISDLTANNPNQYGDFLFAGYDQTGGDITTWEQACPHEPDPGLHYPWLRESESIPSDGCAELDLELFSKPLDASIPNRVSYKTATLSIAALQGRRLDLRFEGSAAVLTLDGEEIEREILPVGAGNYFGIKATVRHQFTGWQQPTSGPTIYLRGGTYALAYACQASRHWIEHRRKKLAAYHSLPTSDPTREHKLKAESLFITGLNWMHQTELAMANSTPMHGGRWVFQHRFGRVADEYAVQGGYFVDIPLQQMASASHTSVWTPAVRRTSFLANNFMQSSLEHGVVEQVLDPDSAAASIVGGAGVSTIKACVSAKTKSDGGYDYLYSLNPALWEGISGVYDPSSPQYPASVLYSQPDYNLIKQAMDEDIASKASTDIPDVNTTVFMPMDGRLGMQDWEGSGYMVLRETPSSDGLHMVMGISGALHGGFTTVKAPVPTRSIQVQGTYGTYTIQPPALPWTLSFDPIDLATGFYYLSATDIVLGDGKLPRGATFTRSYHGSKVSEDNAGLGYGWDHSLNIRVLLRSDAALAMGEGTAEEAAGFAVAMLALYQLLDGTTAAVAKDWAVAAEVANWGANQFTHNAAAVMLGDRTLQFHRLPDGTYLPARGTSVALTREGGDNHFVLRERHGNTYVFDASRKLSTVTDLWGKQATFSWTGDYLWSVTDCFNRVIRFYRPNSSEVTVVGGSDRDYLATNQKVYFIIADGELRGAGYWTIDASTWTNWARYEYDSTGQHRITVLRDNDQRVIAENFYDAEGRVFQQRSMGDTERTWNYKYAYGETVELKPAKNLDSTTRDRNFYRFDSRNRQILQIDGLGKPWTKSYDGQDHVVQELTPLTAGSASAGRTVYDANHNVIERTDRYGRSEYWQYSQDGQFHLLTHTDRRGKVTTFSDYNAMHQPETVTDAENRVTGFTYAPLSSHGAGKVATIKKAGQLKVTYSYDYEGYGLPGYGNVTTITYPRTGDELADPVEKRAYSIHGDLTRLQTPRAGELGIEIVTTYDERRRKRTVTLPGSLPGEPNVVSETVYDSNGNAWKTISPKGALTVGVDDFTTVHTYLASGKIDTTATPDGVIRHFYDFQDDEVKVTDALNLSTTIGYDAAGRKKTVSNHLDQTVTSYFDDDGRGIRVADPLDHGDTLSYAAHVEGELQTSLNSLSQTSSRRLDKNGNWTHYTNARSKTWAMSYDDTGMMEEMTTPENRMHRSYYDDQGRKWKTVEPSLQAVELQFDARDRVETRTVKRADGSVESSASFTYDKNGNVFTVVEGRQTITRTYDRQDRVLSYTLVVAPLMNADVEVESGWGYTLGYRYDANGNLKELIYPDGRSVRYTYDEMDRMKTVTDWAERVTTYTWDAGGRLRRVDRPNKTARVLSYDDAGRLTRADELLPGDTKGGVFPTAQYTFVTPTQPSGPLGWWKPNAGVLSYWPVIWYSVFPQERVPPHLAGRPVFRRFYGAYWPGINDHIPSPTNRWQFFGASVPPSGFAAGEGAWIETRLAPWSSNTQWVSTYGASLWEYWIAGYPNQSPTPSPTQPGRLISSQVFAYDAAGRVEKSFRLPQPHPLPSRPMTGASYDGDNRFLGCTEYPAALWEHDTDGNLTHGLLPAAGAAAPAAADFTWDVRNRLSSLVNTATAEQHHHRYDPEGNRIETRQPYSYYGYVPSNGPPSVNNPPPPPVLLSGVKTSRRAISAHGPGGLSRVLVSWNSHEGGDRYYVHGLGLLYDSNGMSGAQEDLNYYHYDHQGNTTAVTTSPQYQLSDVVRIKARWEYDPYGTVTHYESPGYQVSTPYLYGGEHGVMTDAATGLLHMRARYYHPYLKRFISEDPIGFDGGMNWYGYASGDPVMGLDPSGLADYRVIFYNGNHPGGKSRSGESLMNGYDLKYTADAFVSAGLYDKALNAPTQADIIRIAGEFKANGDRFIKTGLLDHGGYYELPNVRYQSYGGGDVMLSRSTVSAIVDASVPNTTINYWGCSVGATSAGTGYLKGMALGFPGTTFTASATDLKITPQSGGKRAYISYEAHQLFKTVTYSSQDQTYQYLEKSPNPPFRIWGGDYNSRMGSSGSGGWIK